MIACKIAPDAKYFVSDVYTYGIEWFISNNCDVVNCSFAYLNNTKSSDMVHYTDGEKRYRIDISGVYDYQIATTGISVVISSGNYCGDNTNSAYNPQNKVCNPGLAYNAITVGGVNRYPAFLSYKIKSTSDASYVSDIPYVKPEISAMFSFDIPVFGSGSGTSFSAPQVTGAIALLLEKNNSYASENNKIKAKLMATSNKTADFVEDRGFFDNRVGAGYLNATNFLDNTFDGNVYVAKTSPAGTDVFSTFVYLSKNQQLSVAISWDVEIGVNTGILTNYALKITSSQLTNSIISNSVFNGTELIRMTAPANGYYFIRVHQCENINSNKLTGDKIAISYQIQ